MWLKKISVHLFILLDQEWKEKLLACEAQFVEENKFGLVDMTIPAKQEKKRDAMESLGGTFRKLNVDWGHGSILVLAGSEAS